MRIFERLLGKALAEEPLIGPPFRRMTLVGRQQRTVSRAVVDADHTVAAMMAINYSNCLPSAGCPTWLADLSPLRLGCFLMRTALILLTATTSLTAVTGVANARAVNDRDAQALVAKAMVDRYGSAGVSSQPYDYLKNIRGCHRVDRRYRCKIVHFMPGNTIYEGTATVSALKRTDASGTVRGRVHAYGTYERLSPAKKFSFTRTVTYNITRD